MCWKGSLAIKGHLGSFVSYSLLRTIVVNTSYWLSLHVKVASIRLVKKSSSIRIRESKQKILEIVSWGGPISKFFLLHVEQM